jgi:transcriptional regulator
MYIPPHFEERDVAVLHALVRSHPLGTWVTEANGMLVVNHIPFVLDPTDGEFGRLVGHVSRANDVWKIASISIESVVVFQGPQRYITPSWYATKQDSGKVVPTWNYAVVHAHGMPRIVDDPEWLRRHVTALTNEHESSQREPWRVTDAPEDYVTSQLKGIVGIEIPITRLVGKWKTSQNRSMQDRLGVIAGLERDGDEESQMMARLVRERMKTDD